MKLYRAFTGRLTPLNCFASCGPPTDNTQRRCGKGLIEAFEEYLQKRDRSAYTVNGYVRDLQAFFVWLQEQTGREIPPGEVTVFDVKRYRDDVIYLSLLQR